jgi:hypothetical protein
MEQVKKIGQLCRQHYEKMVLVIVLLLLAGAVWVLYGKSQEENDKVRQMTEGYTKKSGKPIPAVILQPFESAMRSATNRPALNYAGQHNLFNPVKWQQNRGGGSVIKVQSGTEVGVGAMRIVSVTPLVLSISFEKTAASGTEVTGYHTMVTNEMATTPRLRRIAQYVAMDPGKNPMFATNTQVFVMTDLKGTPDAPTEFGAVLREFENEKISFGPGKPYTRTVGYETELKYLVSGKTYPRLRKDSSVDIEGEMYKVVDIVANKVVLSDDSNGKRYTIDQMVAP